MSAVSSKTASVYLTLSHALSGIEETARLIAGSVRTVTESSAPPTRAAPTRAWLQQVESKRCSPGKPVWTRPRAAWKVTTSSAIVAPAFAELVGRNAQLRIGNNGPVDADPCCRLVP